eukprot:1503477-Rhodomonas_salina.1
MHLPAYAVCPVLTQRIPPISLRDASTSLCDVRYYRSVVSCQSPVLTPRMLLSADAMSGPDLVHAACSLSGGAKCAVRARS